MADSRIVEAIKNGTTRKADLLAAEYEMGRFIASEPSVRLEALIDKQQEPEEIVEIMSEPPPTAPKTFKIMARNRVKNQKIMPSSNSTTSTDTTTSVTTNNNDIDNSSNSSSSDPTEKSNLASKNVKLLISKPGTESLLLLLPLLLPLHPSSIENNSTDELRPTEDNTPSHESDSSSSNNRAVNKLRPCATSFDPNAKAHGYEEVTIIEGS
ncbi:hypothetical protein H4Q26_014714 [Puccinia striiformis f. sp. tritici PST-130]|nr:hypothetical protein H4Q26_014714 [Puccinia striiformis f. sp. tritici PST-130]